MMRNNKQNRAEKITASLKWVWYGLCHPRCHLWIRLILSIVIMGGFLDVLASGGSGNDILQGTDASLWATLNGTGKKYIYAAEGILGLAAYMKTKNLLVLTGIVVVSIFFNIILSIAGESA